MVIDWLARLREQGRFAKRMAHEVPEALSDYGTTLQEAQQILHSVENCALAFEQMVDDMRRVGVDSAFLRAAESMSMIWADLSRLAANRVRDLHADRSVASRRPGAA